MQDGIPSGRSDLAAPERRPRPKGHPTGRARGSHTPANNGRNTRIQAGSQNTGIPAKRPDFAWFHNGPKTTISEDATTAAKTHEVVRGQGRPAGDTSPQETQPNQPAQKRQSPRASCEIVIGSGFFYPKCHCEGRSAAGTPRLEDGGKPFVMPALPPGSWRREGHGASLPVMRASAREEMRRISLTIRSSSRLFAIHSRYRTSSSSVSFKPTVFPRALRVQWW